MKQSQIVEAAISSVREGKSTVIFVPNLSAASTLLRLLKQAEPALQRVAHLRVALGAAYIEVSPPSDIPLRGTEVDVIVDEAAHIPSELYEAILIAKPRLRSTEGQSQTGSERENDAEKEDRRTNERQLD